MTTNLIKHLRNISTRWKPIKYENSTIAFYILHDSIQLSSCARNATDTCLIKNKQEYLERIKDLACKD